MTPKLLLADDSVTIQRVIELTFADENVQVVAVGDGKEAIERLKTDRPDIVLADVGMPEHDGYEVAAFIKGNPELAHIPVLLLTGAFEPIDETRAKSVGCEGVLVKPFEPQMVISRVRELLGRKPRQSEAAPAAPQPVEAVEPAQPMAAPAQPAAAAAPPPAGKSADALEDYFDRLDVALSTLNTAPPALEPVPAELRTEPVRRPEPAPAAIPVSGARGPESPGTAGVSSASNGMPPLHEAFAALLSAERGLPLHPNGPTREAITEDVIEEVVRRVMARMSNDAMRRAVLDAAERMVRDEIEKIKKTT